jgi:hypothetical protein
MFHAASLISGGRTGQHAGEVPTARSSVVDRPVSATRPPWLQRLGSTAGLVLVVWAVPLLVLAVPLALVWRAVLEVTTWRHRGRRPTTLSSSPISTTGTEPDSRAHRLSNAAEDQSRVDSFQARPSLWQALGYVVLILISGFALPILGGFKRSTLQPRVSLCGSRLRSRRAPDDVLGIVASA